MITKAELEKLKEELNRKQHWDLLISFSTVLRLIEALGVATEALEAYANANSQYAQEALNKIYG